MTIVSGIIGAVVFAAVAVGLVEVVKNFLPKDLNSKIKTVIAIVIEVVVAVVGAILIKNDGAGAVVITAIGTVALAQLFYEIIVNFINKLVEFLKSRVSK